MIRKIGIWLVTACVCLLGITGCGQNFHQSPDFTKDVTVKYKISSSYSALYHLESDQGTLGEGWGVVSFRAPNDFAEVGDVITYTNGCLFVK